MPPAALEEPCREPVFGPSTAASLAAFGDAGRPAKSGCRDSGPHLTASDQSQRLITQPLPWDHAEVLRAASESSWVFKANWTRQLGQVHAGFPLAE